MFDVILSVGSVRDKLGGSGCNEIKLLGRDYLNVESKQGGCGYPVCG